MNIKPLTVGFQTLNVYFVTAKLMFLILLVAVTSVSQSAFAQSTAEETASRRMRLRSILSRTQFEATEHPLASDTSSPQTAQSLTALTPSAEADIDTSFNATVAEGPGEIENVIVQPDGKILVGGFFAGVNGTARHNLARFNADNTLDESFNPGTSTNASVEAMALQSDGKILIGGTFTNFNGVALNRLARLNVDGSLDSTFNVGTGASSLVETIAVQSDGKILIGGSFSTYNGTPRSRIARLNTDGSLDTSFNASLNGVVNSILIQPDGKILVGGSFSPRIFRFNSDGTTDSSFVSGAVASVTTIKLLNSGKILIGYDYSSTNTSAALLNANGSLDVAYTAPNGGQIGVRGALLYLPDGKVLVGGGFVSSNGSETGAGVVRFNADGTIDSSFPTINTNFGLPQALNLMSNGKILLAGNFTTYNGVDRLHLAQFNQDGTLDANFNASISTAGIVYEVVVQSDGKIIIGGNFEYINGVRRNHLARLNPDGTLDTTFNIGTAADYFIMAVALQPDGKIIIGGYFYTFNGVQTGSITRLNQDGSRDTSFIVSGVLPYFVHDIKLQPDNKIVVGGYVLASSNADIGITRLNPDGSRDVSFSDISSLVDFISLNAVSIQPDGKIVVGGQIFFNSGNRSLARLNSDGTLDSSFTTFGIGGFPVVYASEIQQDNKILVNNFRLNSNGSVDSTFNPGGTSANNVVREIFLQPNGKILIGGFFTAYNNISTNRLARVNSDGTLDTTFNVGAGANDFVDAIAQQNDGKILVGGRFTTYNGQLRRGLVRLQGSAVNRKTAFDFDGDGKADVGVFRQGNWFVLRSSQGVSSALFGNPTDKITPADYDGDGKTDIAVFRDGTWFLLRSTQGFTAIPFGQAGDVPQSGDFDGDGKADIAVFRNGNWFILNSAGNPFVTSLPFGQAGDVPAAADYDGDGKTDVAVFRDGYWYVLRSSNNSVLSAQFGQAGDVPVVADYDGDGKTDFAVFRGGTWYVLGTTQGFSGVLFGFATDKPVPADYDGDGKADVAVFRDGNWYLLRSAQGFTSVLFGIANDIPVQSAYLP